MKVKELIEELKFFDGEQEIYFAFPSGDFWGTTIAKGVNNVEHTKVVESSYHDTYKVIDSDREDRYDEDELQNVIIIS